MKCNKNLLKKQKILFKTLGTNSPFIEGSISTVKRICGNKNCRCRKDPEKKHPAMFLTWKENLKTKALYIPVEQQINAKMWNENYKKLKILIKKISDFHKKILKMKA